jgi:hypothetical protein
MAREIKRCHYVRKLQRVLIIEYRQLMGIVRLIDRERLLKN